MLLDRRAVLLGCATSLALGRSMRAGALEMCPADGLPPGTCSAFIDPARFQSQAAARMQEESQWCWAACISMVCRFHGFDLSQESIVRQMYGSVVNMPADDRVLTAAINRRWTTTDGRNIDITASTFSPALGTSDVMNSTVVDDLRNNRPLINGSRNHATVTARVDYTRTNMGNPEVFKVHVIDPWPGATNNQQRARFLEQDEMTPVQLGGQLRYVASVRVVAV